MVLLLHKKALVDFPMATTVIFYVLAKCTYGCTFEYIVHLTVLIPSLLKNFKMILFEGEFVLFDVQAWHEGLKSGSAR